MNSNIPNAYILGLRISDASHKAARANIFSGEALRSAREYERKGDLVNAAQQRQEAKDYISVYEYEKQKEKELIAELSNFKFEPLSVLEAAE